jgi:universal stress protein A
MKLPHVVTNTVSTRTHSGGNPSGGHLGSTGGVASFTVAIWAIGSRAESALQEQFKETESERTKTKNKNKEKRCVVGTMSKFARGAPAMKSLGIADHDSAAAGKQPGHVHHLSRILFCADFSENSEQTLQYAISATAEYDAELTLLHVLEEVPSPDSTEQAMVAAAGRLGELIPPETGKTLKIKTAVRTGKPYWQIIQLALEAGIDLVTMGVRGRGALDLAVFGSTTYRVMQLGSCPVLAVRS